MSSQWTFLAVYIALAFPALGGVAYWLRRRQYNDSVDAAQTDFFAPPDLSDGDVDDRFAAIVAQLRAEADQRICEAHERNTSELPEIEGGQR